MGYGVVGPLTSPSFTVTEGMTQIRQKPATG
ncbi:hypothetical protein SUDANB51_03390 [Streptomyces sp. enrichment culture]